MRPNRMRLDNEKKVPVFNYFLIFRNYIEVFRELKSQNKKNVRN